MNSEITTNGTTEVQVAERSTYEQILTPKVKVALVAHFVNAVPIERLNIDKRTKEHVVLVDHVYWLLKKNPFLDSHALFYELSKQHYKGDSDVRGNATRLARRLDKMLEFAIDNTRPDSRKRDEMKVRHVADRLMERGLATDNDRAMAKGADLLTRVARLEQPESEQADMANVAFLPSVVVTDIREVDETKDYIDDEQSRRIMEKYGGYVDEKRKMIEEKVAILEASGKQPQECDKDASGEPGREI